MLPNPIRIRRSTQFHITMNLAMGGVDGGAGDGETGAAGWVEELQEVVVDVVGKFFEICYREGVLVGGKRTEMGSIPF
jgi:hypothetical protein